MPSPLASTTSYVGRRPFFQSPPPTQMRGTIMNELTRRGFLTGTGATAAAGLLASDASGGEPAPAAALKYRLGIVTYNIAANWDVPTILRICRAFGLAAVEMRT